MKQDEKELIAKESITPGDAQPSLQHDKTRNENYWCFDWLEATPLGDTERAVAVKATLWTPGESITISFLDGDPEVQEKVKRTALKWVGPKMANLSFQFRKDTYNTDIRISFRYPGSWSVLGTTCRKITDITRPTMNFGWLTKKSTEDEIERVVLHEFGHALGLTHEHLHPEGDIDWDTDRVRKDLSGPPNNWSDEVINTNMFNVLNKAETNFTSLDRNSIMMYPIPAKWTKNGFSVGLNSGLSDADKQFIKQQYP